MEKLPPPKLEWSSGQARHPDFDDGYFSRDGGLAESEYVFIEGCDLPRRFANGDSLGIGELGFGTGLNFLLSWRAWENAGAGQALTYVAVEAEPLSAAQMEKALAPWPELESYRAKLCQNLPPAEEGHHVLALAPRLRLHLLYGEALVGLRTFDARIDAWFFDGFAPARNPAMWREELLRRCLELCRPGARLATYTAAGFVRRRLTALGARMEKRPGYGQKREMLQGIIEQPPIDPRSPWLRRPDPLASQSLLIWGNGIVGCVLARSAAEAGVRCQVIGTREGTSWRIPAFAVRPYPEKQTSPSERLYRQAWHWARRFYVEHVDVTAWQDFGPDGGVLRPAEACEQLLDHPLIETVAASVTKHDRHDGQWRLLLDDNSQLAAPLLALCTAQPPPGLMTDYQAWLRAVAGQAVRLRQPAPAPCFGSAHWLPLGGESLLGSSYRVGSDDLEPNPRESEEILRKASASWPDIDWSSQRIIATYTGQRWTSPDHLPLLGPAPDLAAWRREYADLRHGEAHRPFAGPLCQPGLWMNLAHGSRGATLAPLAAEHLLALWQDQASPLTLPLQAAVHPGRFLLRELRRA